MKTTDPTLANLLGRNWWLILLRGIAAILFGFLAFAWPGATLITLIAFFGAYVLIDGVLALVAAFRGGTGVSRGWLIFTGLLGIAAAIGTVIYPGVTALVLVLFIGFMSIVFGAIVWLMPGPGALAIVWLIGAYSIAFGAVLTALAFRVRHHRTREIESEEHFHEPPPPHPA